MWEKLREQDTHIYAYTWTNKQMNILNKCFKYCNLELFSEVVQQSVPAFEGYSMHPWVFILRTNFYLKATQNQTPLSCVPIMASFLCSSGLYHIVIFTFSLCLSHEILRSPDGSSSKHFLSQYLWGLPQGSSQNWGKNRGAETVNFSLEATTYNQ